MTRKTPACAAALAILAAFSLSAQTAIEPAKPVAPTMRAGPLDAITDVPGIEVGSYDHN